MKKTTQSIVIASFNSKYVHSSLGIWYLFEALRDSQFDCHIYESTIHKDPQTCAEEILAKDPEIAIFSCYIWNITTVLEVCQIIKNTNSQVKILLGGPEAEHNRQDLLQNYSFIDGISLGEGEYTIADTLTALSKGCPMEGKALAFISKEDGSYKEVESSCEATVKNSLQEKILANLYSIEYFNHLQGRISYIETSRGCPYRCAFCLSGSHKLKFFPLDICFKNIDLLAKSGTKTIKFVDRTFNANEQHANAIWNYVKNLDTDICFHFEIAGDILTEESLRILDSMPIGRVQLEIGIQSINEETLEAIHRKTNTKVLISNIEKLISFNNMHIHIDLIAGLPLEDLESFAYGLNTIFKIKAHMLQLGFLKILSGSTMHTHGADFPCEYEKKPPYQVISTPWVSEADLEKISTAEDSLERLSNSQRFNRTVNFLLEKTHQTPFEFFANVPKVTHGTSMEDYAQLIFDTYKYLGEDELRDIMALDCLESNSTGRLYKVLQRHDPALKKAKIYISENFPTQGVKRGVAILYSQNKIAFVDYKDKDFITGRYESLVVDRKVEALN